MPTDSAFAGYTVDTSQATASTTASRGASASLRSVQQRLFDVVSQPEGESSCLQRLADLLRQATDLFALGWFESSAPGRLTMHPSLVHFIPQSEDAFEKLLSTTATESARESATCSRTCLIDRSSGSSINETFLAIAAPARSQSGVFGVLAAAFRASSQSSESLVSLIEAAAAAIGLNHCGQRLFSAEQEIAAIAAIVDLAVRVESSESCAEASRILANELARHTGQPFVAIAMKPSRERRLRCRLQAINGEASVSKDSERTRTIEAACDELLVRDGLTSWPPESLTERHGLLALKQLQSVLRTESIVGGPLRDHSGEATGAFVISGARSALQEASLLQFIRACEHRLGGSLKLVREAERPRWRRWLDEFKRKSGQAPLKTGAMCASGIALLLCVPLPYRVKCHCELQPEVRRFVAAPFDGSLEKAFVEPGELVEAGQLLARMDAKEIHWELAGIEAERGRASKESDSALAKQDFAGAQISRYDRERLELRQKLLTHRGDHLEIRAPIDGLVIVGDLKKSEGIPLKTGDQLFEIAPLDRMIVEVSIPEADITHAQVAQTTSITLDAFPGESWTGTIARIHPRSEIREQEHVFIAEVELDNTSGRLRPGLIGRASVSTSWQPTGWIAFHKPWHAFWRWFGW